MIYLDNNATTQVADEVREAMLPFLGESFANPSSPYEAGRAASRVISEARIQTSDLIGAPSERVFFTSGGTEGNNTVLQAGLAMRPGRKRVVISSVEHSSVLAFAAYLSVQGYDVVRIPVADSGELDEEALRSAITEDTAIVSIMKANNETGIVFPVENWIAWAREKGALFHTDAVQVVGRLDLHDLTRDVDFLTGSGHKLHGPKGIGFIYVREGLKMPPYLIGGDQEYGRRAGTENVPGIAGLGKACELARDFLPHYKQRVEPLRDELESGLVAAIPEVRVTAAKTPRLPNTSHLLIHGVDGEALLNLLDMESVCCSSGSACMSGSVEPSHVLEAMGISRAWADGAIRLSFSRFSSPDDVRYVINTVPRCIKQLRDVSDRS